MEPTSIVLELPPGDAWYLALFLKRCHSGMIQECANPACPKEADRITEAIGTTLLALTEAGVKPR